MSFNISAMEKILFETKNYNILFSFNIIEFYFILYSIFLMHVCAYISFRMCYLVLIVK